jgi:hypothetical protein
MTLPPRRILLPNLACLLVLAWLYGGDVFDASRARSAEASAFMEPPSLVRPSIVLGFGALALGAAVWGLLRRRGQDYKGYRVLPIVLVSALFVDLFFAEQRSPLSSLDIATLSLQSFQDMVQQQATLGGVPTEPGPLNALLEKLPGHPPYLVRGQPVSRYTLQVRQDCEGPVSSAPGLQPGTFIYCVAKDTKGAWLTLVGLPAERRFGTPDVLSAGGEPRFLVIHALPPEDEDAEGSPFEPASEAQGSPPGP